MEHGAESGLAFELVESQSLHGRKVCVHRIALLVDHTACVGDHRRDSQASTLCLRAHDSQQLDQVPAEPIDLTELADSQTSQHLLKPLSASFCSAHSPNQIPNRCELMALSYCLLSVDQLLEVA